MGALIVADDWLLDLALRDARAQHIAYTLLRTQIQTAKQRGHILHFNTEALRKRINKATYLDELNRVVMPCSSCGTAAILKMWITSAPLDEHLLDLYRRKVAHAVPPIDLLFLDQCQGNPTVEALVDVTYPEGSE